jgi:predicted MFS family arabinose efflux permease
MGGFGPAIPLLQADQGTSGAIAGLHGTALGLSSILAGVFNARLVHRYGRYQSAWIGIALFLFGAFFFVTLPLPYQTITSIFIVGVGVTIAIANTVTYLTGHFEEHAPRAVSQNNGVTSFFSLIGTVTIGILASTAISWRFGLLACFPFAAAIYLTLGRAHSPEHIPDGDGRQRGRLPKRFWYSWIGLVFTISTEFAIVFWAAALLRERTGTSPSLSTTLVLAFPLGMFLGRWFGTYVKPALGIDARLRAILALQFSGFVIFWASEMVFTSFISLLLIGLGTSMQFTLTTLRLLSFGNGKTDLAMGYVALASGIAIAGSPFILGALADQIGIISAYLIVPIFMSIAFAIVLAIPIKQSDEARGH